MAPRRSYNYNYAFNQHQHDYTLSLYNYIYNVVSIVNNHENMFQSNQALIRHNSLDFHVKYRAHSAAGTLRGARATYYGAPIAIVTYSSVFTHVLSILLY